MKNLLNALILVTAGVLPAGETVFENPFANESSHKAWNLDRRYCRVVQEKGSAGYLEVKNDRENDPKSIMALFYPDVKKLAGKRLVMTGEVWRDMQKPLGKWQGGKFQINYQTPRGWDWPGVYLEHGQLDWKPVRLTLDLPHDTSKVMVALGTQDAHGTIRFRRMKLEATDTVFDLSQVANMGFKDEKARDGKGGWSDQGPENDASRFRYKEQTYAGIPFRVTMPERNKGKSCLVFRSDNFRNGLKEAEIDFSKGENEGKYLYLLHTLTWGSGWKKEVGSVELIGKNGKKQLISVSGAKDVSDWWTPSPRPNGFPAAIWPNNSNGTVGLYVSKFKVNPEIGALKKVIFRSANSVPVWIVVGATLSEKDYSFPKKTVYTVTANEKWKELNHIPSVRKDSALDLSFLTHAKEAGADGRIIVRKDGQLVFEKKPDAPLRFNATAILGLPTFQNHQKYKNEFSDKKAIEEYADQLQRAGYNMIRLHYMDATLLMGAKKDYEFRPDILDRLDYFFAQLKKRGIYVNLDAMCSRIGYSHGYSWSAGPGDNRSFKLDIHFNPSVRENWFKGVRKLLTHKNPYTGKSLAEDPLLAMIVGFNEQEFAFANGRPEALKQALPRWRAFLEKRYSDIGALNKSWKTDFKSFADIPIFTFGDAARGDSRANDINRFYSDCEKELTGWYKNSLKKIGYKGLFANYNMGKQLRYNIVRDADDYIAMNSYHAHPFDGSINTRSSIQSNARVMQDFITAKRYGKPMVVTEHSHGYWNRYRAEQGLIMGAYSALQDFGGLTVFAHAVTVNPKDKHPIATFTTCTDPITRASEFLTTLIFRRGDVKSAPKQVRILLNPEAIYNSGSANDALNSEEAALGLVAGLTLEVDSPKKKLGKNERSLPGFGGAPILFQVVGGIAGWSQAIESVSKNFRFDDEIAAMKKDGFLPKDNRSSYKNGIFESMTGEILLDANKNFLSVNTPRVQGVYAEAGTKTAFPEFEIKNLTTRGCLTAAAVDGEKSLRDASRIVVVYSTNAMNSGEVFSDDTLRTRLKNGTAPLLYETGKFTVSLENKNASKMKAYALATDGTRIAELPLKKIGNGKLELTVDTAKLPTGPALYFELN